MSGLDWNREGLIWPHREASTFVTVGKARWHVQRMGSGPPLLLLHGTGASVHSWRDLMPLLAQDYTVIAPDLPRHAFTTGHDAYAMSLPAMAAEVAELLKALDVQPAAIIGHSSRGRIRRFERRGVRAGGRQLGLLQHLAGIAGERTATAGSKHFVALFMLRHLRPVDPKPPVPRPEPGNSSTSTNCARSTF